MKKIILTLVFASAMTTLSAQTETVKSTEDGFNKWSVELAGGFNKPQRPMTSGYATTLISPYVVDLGVRYMFNNKFGLKADLGLNSFTGKKESVDFDTKYYRVDLQGVANLGRIMNFETWTQSIGLLGHAGFGLSLLERKDPSYLKDRMGNFMAGLTGQIKLTDRIALTGDFTTILNAKQNLAFDGASSSSTRGFGGILFNGTAGITVYLGKNVKHADWVLDNEDRFNVIDNRLTAIETKMLDADNDGVADYLDQEPNTAAGAMVDTKGKSIDKNNNNVPDETEAYILKNYVSKTDDTTTVYDNELIKSLINGGYVAVYFDFDKSKPTNVSTEGIDFILTYLRNNPSASVDIIGHADELGRSAYNDKLSNARATNVKNTLVKANIDASRLNVIAAGEDTSVDKASENARKLVRRVTFTVK
ncbi:OmpA family protein [Flavobacterium gawalongense]|uniref:OmpA family protein n=1 Tax=Flavobacterium gawalongense TaxID=2594432 RepID=A0A553BW47_9FLAO|nr:OmpA family protein [Flavobacterium gawalongense]TRX02049.1 OmpA family protein [Flavobacterium gawalongense]TRX06577.1 OmpA family protein [Flavobacterium gawalongense]TRX12494.1 OmpA family protein [Flavobacterium gawalongense]TRX12685.1 OmpA family protein [Flavobacterium gawalongense]TRX30526.1 OmpA family protein [Flavobacterium gawalongense]